MQKTIKRVSLKPIYPMLKMLLVALLLSAFKSGIDTDPSFSALIRIPQRVALLLPLQNEWKTISEAIQAGFIAANTVAHKPLLINTLNTKQYRTIQASYQKAIQQGVDLVIGPLLKEEIQALGQCPALKVPVLTLNYLDPQQEAPANFYQFGLSPLDEVKQITQLAKAREHQSALILVPDNPWGAKLAELFAQHWQTLGGTIAGRLHYSSTLPILNRQIRTFLAFSPPQKRRTDFDVIFLGATSESGRQVHPLLAFYFASNVPIYATAAIYNQSVPVHLNRDLDNIIICDTPWSVGMTHIQSHISTHCMAQAPQHFSHYARYYALGADAFQLAMQLVQLDQDERKTIHGASGELSLNQERYIVRKPPCAKFKRGIPQPLSYDITTTRPSR